MLRKVLPAILLIVVAAMANAEKISGFVKGSPSGNTFTVGSKEGTFKVDASKAKVTMKGKSFKVSDLTGGSQVTVEGTKKGTSFMATTVNVGFVRGASTTKTKIKATPVKPATTATATKPATKTTKTKSKSTAKKTEDPVKTEGTTKPATKTKTKSKTKADTTKPAGH